MKHQFQTLIVVSLVLAIISGCATMNNDGTRTKAEGTAIGAGIGAVLGAGIGALIGGRDGAKWGAGIGAALGGAGGYLMGSSVADRKQKYANEEDRLNGETQVVAKYNEELANFNSQTATRITTLEQEVASLKAQNEAGRAKESVLTEKQSEINKFIAEANEIKEQKNKELVLLDEYQQSIAQTQEQANIEKLDKEVRALKDHIALLDTNNRQLAQMSESLTIRK